MTNKEIFERFKRHKRLEQRSQTITADLRSSDDAVKHEAAEIIEWLMERGKSLRRELNEEITEGQRAARSAYRQGREDEGRGEW